MHNIIRIALAQEIRKTQKKTRARLVFSPAVVDVLQTRATELVFIYPSRFTVLFIRIKYETFDTIK